MLSAAPYGLGFFLLSWCMAVWALVGVPELSSRVTDLAATLSAEQVSALENKLAAFEAKSGSQIAVLVVPTTGEKDIAEFGIEVADLSKLGRKGIDDGVILIVAKDDRKLRLEVGYGLEGVIPDAIAKRVIEETIAPHFKEGDYAGGIDAGVGQLMGLIEGEALPAPTDSQGEDDGAFMFILFGGLVLGFLLSAAMGRMMGGLLAGLGSVAVSALVLGLALSMALFVGFMVFCIVATGMTGGSGWSSGGGFGGSSGGGSWGGGGGGFGGGGASGSW